MMNKIDNSGQGLARLGRDEDQYMAHVAQGEMVVPPIISPETRARIEAEMKAVGLSPDEYTVGAGMSINPITGMPEFGWLKKTFKSIKKVVKKVLDKTQLDEKIVAEYNHEKFLENKEIENICPFWRIIEPKSNLAQKLNFDKMFIVRHRKVEKIEP